MTTDHRHQILNAAARLGAEHGHAAGTWYEIPDAEAAQRTLEALENCELEYPSPLSGEFADDVNSTRLVAMLTEDYPEISDDDTDFAEAIFLAYETDYVTAYGAEIERAAIAQLPPGPRTVRADGDEITRATEYGDETDSVGIAYDDNENGMGVRFSGTGAWLNSAQVHLDDDEDSVTVSISVGDPRGAFTMTIRRIPDGAGDHAGRLVMYVPDPSDGMLHRPLTPVRPGTFLIG